MKYKIVPKEFEYEIEADNPEEAMNKFVLQMDMNMNLYMEAAEKRKTNLEKFAYEETKYRLKEEYGCYDEEKIEKVASDLADYLIYDESAINYDGMDDVIAEAMKEN